MMKRLIVLSFTVLMILAAGSTQAMASGTLGYFSGGMYPGGGIEDSNSALHLYNEIHFPVEPEHYRVRLRYTDNHTADQAYSSYSPLKVSRSYYGAESYPGCYRSTTANGGGTGYRVNIYCGTEYVGPLRAVEGQTSISSPASPLLKSWVTHFRHNAQSEAGKWQKQGLPPISQSNFDQIQSMLQRTHPLAVDTGPIKSELFRTGSIILNSTRTRLSAVGTKRGDTCLIAELSGSPVASTCIQDIDTSGAAYFGYSGAKCECVWGLVADDVTSLSITSNLGRSYAISPQNSGFEWAARSKGERPTSIQTVRDGIRYSVPMHADFK